MHEKIYKLKPIKEFLMANRNNVEIIDKEIAAKIDKIKQKTVEETKEE